MSSLTFYGGVNEIGGNKILFEDEGTRIFFDFGMGFKRSGLFFSEFLQPRKCNGIMDFIEFGLLPKIEGIYRRDYLEHCEIKPRETSVDGLFLTHAHADHSAYVHHLREDIPIYGSPETFAVMQAIEDTGSGGFSDLLNLCQSFQVRPSKRGNNLTRIIGEESKIPRKCFICKNKNQINDLTIESIPVNHSLPGAMAYIIHSSVGPIVYTGDLRFHGHGGYLTEKFVKRAADVEPVLMITEGTRINDTTNKDQNNPRSEEELKERISELIRENDKKLVIANWPVRDTDRMISFYTATVENDRKLVINMRQAYLLEKLNEAGVTDIPDINDDHIRIYIPRKTWGIFRDERYPDYIQEQDYEKWERRYLYHKNAITDKEIREDQDEFVLRCDYFELKNLIDIKPKEGSLYLRSVTEPFDEEMEIDDWRVQNWLDHFKLRKEQVHVSGHAGRPELISMIKKIQPKKIVPVHTEYPEGFRIDGIETIMIKEGDTIRL